MPYYSDDKIHYTLGFLFDEAKRYVVLVYKLRGYRTERWNGLGGHIEASDPSDRDAMARECHEESGVVVPAESWQAFARIVTPKAQVHVFYAVTDDAWKADTRTDERIGIHLIESLTDTMDDTPALIQLAFLHIKCGAVTLIHIPPK